MAVTVINMQDLQGYSPITVTADGVRLDMGSDKKITLMLPAAATDIFVSEGDDGLHAHPTPTTANLGAKWKKLNGSLDSSWTSSRACKEFLLRRPSDGADSPNIRAFVEFK